MTSFRTLLTGALAVASLLFSQVSVAPALAQSVQRIAAVVNEDVISVYDLEERIRLVMVTSGVPDTPDVRKRLVPQVMRTLIDESLQNQEAQRISASVTDKEVNDAVARIEQANRMPPGALLRELDASGAGRSSLLAQIKATIAWNKVITRRLRPSLQVGEDEIDEVIERINSNKGSTEYLLAELFLAVETPDQEEEVRQRAEDLIGQMQRGASFAAIAQQFSQAASASQGGDIGWVERGQLDEEVQPVIDRLERNRATPPIRTATGFYIYLLRDKRTLAAANPDDATVTLTQLILPLEPDAPASEREAQTELAKTVQETVSGCDDLKRAAGELHVEINDPTPDLRVGDLNPALRPTVNKLKVGEASEPIVNDTGVLLVMVCKRTEAPSTLPSRDDIADNLTRQRLDLIARRYLRDLRRQAFIDVRV